MNSKPEAAIKSKVIQFNMQQASGNALAESQKKVDRVEKKLLGSTATRQEDGSWDVKKTGSERFKEYVKDKEELAGRGSRRAGDDRWQGKVLKVEEIRMGLVRDQDNKLHSLTKIQPVPSTTQSTKTQFQFPHAVPPLIRDIVRLPISL